MLGEYTKPDGEMLLKLARQSIESKFIAIKPEIPEGKQFKQARGVFVTLTENCRLRGCIGFPYATQSLSQAVSEAAKSAAFEDPRFSPLKEDEVSKIKIEISILTQPSLVKNTKDIEIGKDGLICEYIGFSGLLLPQVAREHKLSKIEFLEALCDKAGLPRDTWQNKNFKLYKFQCQIFSE
jgi:hypothetical protein